MTSTVTVSGIGGPRLTLGFDRFDRLDIDRHLAVHGKLRAPGLDELIRMAEQVDLRGRGGAGFPFARKLMAVAARIRHPTADQTALLPGERADERGSSENVVVVVNGAEGEPFLQVLDESSWPSRTTRPPAPCAPRSASGGCRPASSG